MTTDSHTIFKNDTKFHPDLLSSGIKSSVLHRRCVPGKHRVDFTRNTPENTISSKRTSMTKNSYHSSNIRNTRKKSNSDSKNTIMGHQLFKYSCFDESDGTIRMIPVDGNNVNKINTCSRERYSTYCNNNRNPHCTGKLFRTNTDLGANISNSHNYKINTESSRLKKTDDLKNNSEPKKNQKFNILQSDVIGRFQLKKNTRELNSSDDNKILVKSVISANQSVISYKFNEPRNSFLNLCATSLKSYFSFRSKLTTMQRDPSAEKTQNTSLGANKNYFNEENNQSAQILPKMKLDRKNPRRKNMQLKNSIDCDGNYDGTNMERKTRDINLDELRMFVRDVMVTKLDDMRTKSVKKADLPKTKKIICVKNFMEENGTTVEKNELKMDEHKHAQTAGIKNKLSVEHEDGRKTDDKDELTKGQNYVLKTVPDDGHNTGQQERLKLGNTDRLNHCATDTNVIKEGRVDQADGGLQTPVTGGKNR